MNKRSPQDLKLLPLVVGGVVSFGVARRVSALGGGVPGRVVWLAPVLVTAGVLVVAMLAARVIATRRTLGSRVRLVVLAPDSFDPSLDAVLRCAAHLGRVQQLVGGWLDRRGRAVRVLLDFDGEGRVRYSLSVPRRSLPVVRSALSVYDRVQAHIEPEPEPPAITKPVEVARAELRLARPSSLPLAHLPLCPDPLQSFASVLSRLDLKHDESAQVAIDLLPASSGRRRRLRSRLIAEAKRQQPAATAGLLASTAGAGAGGRRLPAETVQERAAREQIASKLLAHEPIFELQILIQCRSPLAGNAVSCVHGLLSCFESMSAANSLRVVGMRVLGLAFLGSDLPGRRAWFEHRLRTGLFHPGRRCYVTAREMAGFLKPPTVHCSAPEVLRLGAAVYPPPKALPTFAGQKGLVPLGRVRGEQGERRVGLPLNDSFFTYTTGRSRWGKTELALTQFLHLVRSGHGGLFLDPHQDAVQRVKSVLAERELAERVMEVDLVGAHAREGQPGWNLFAARGLDADAAERRVEAIVDSFASALQWGERNNRALTITTQAAGALIELARLLPDGLQPTMFQIPSLLGNPDWLAAALPHLSAPRRQFFTERFPRLSSEAITPVTNLIDRLRSSTPLAALLGAQTTSYDIRRAMDQGRIVLACPGTDGARDRLVANLFVFDLLHAAKSRALLPPERRRPFYVFLDEIQVFDGASNGTLAGLLEQTAKYEIKGFLLNQNPERLTKATLNALTTNRSHLIATALNSHAAGLIAQEWGGDPPAAAITSLPRQTFIAQVTLAGELTRPFKFTTESVQDAFPDAYNPDAIPEIQPIIDKASSRLSTADTIAALDTLDQRIQEHLEARAGTRRQRDESDQPWSAPAQRRTPIPHCHSVQADCEGRQHSRARLSTPDRRPAGGDQR